MSARLLALLLFLPAASAAQGFADLGSEARGYAPVTPPARLEFPRDHAPHPGFRIEWWYLTADLTGADGAEYGAQWTLFRVATAPGRGTGEEWDPSHVWMAHAAVTRAADHRFAERFARAGIGQAGVTLGPFRAWIDDWTMTGGEGPGDALADLDVAAEGNDFAYRLHVATDMAPVPQGDAGFSVKSDEGQASYYYSQPFYRADGTITLDGRKVAVTGRAWLDREWSSQPLTAAQEGWDWFSLHLDGGARVMLYRMRQKGRAPYVTGTWIAPDGTPTTLDADEIVLEPRREAEVAGRTLPVAWRVAIPSRGLDVDTSPLNEQSWMGTTFPYWEGPIDLTGSQTGRGYLEMTGY